MIIKFCFKYTSSIIQYDFTVILIQLVNFLLVYNFQYLITYILMRCAKYIEGFHIKTGFFLSGLVWPPSFTWITELSPMFTRMVVMRRLSRNLPSPNRFINFISTRTTSAGVEVSVSTPCRMLAGTVQTVQVLVFAITLTSECFLERCYSSVWRELWRLQWLLQCFVSTCLVMLCIKRKS